MDTYLLLWFCATITLSVTYQDDLNNGNNTIDNLFIGLPDKILQSDYLMSLVSKKIGNNSLMNDELTPMFHVKSDVNAVLVGRTKREDNWMRNIWSLFDVTTLFKTMGITSTSRRPRHLPLHDDDISPNYHNTLSSNFDHRILPEGKANFFATYPTTVEMNWLEYHRLNTIYNYMMQLQTNDPDLVQIIPIGKSYAKRDILVAKIGKRQPYTKPAIFFEAGIHAREWISPATATFIMKELTEDASGNSDLLQHYDIYILPVANPDGYEYSHTNDRLWRKNRSRKNLFFTCIGVDLNRNFGHRWGKMSYLEQQRSSRSACAETFIGAKPWSEPETRAIRDFIMFKSQAHFVMYISLHSYGQKIIYPWSHTKTPIRDWFELHKIAKLWAHSIFEASNGRYIYKIGSSDGIINYNSHGTSLDWAKGDVGIKWTFLVELPPTHRRGVHPQKGFVLPARHILPAVHSVFDGFKMVAAEIFNSLD